MMNWIKPQHNKNKITYFYLENYMQHEKEVKGGMGFNINPEYSACIEACQTCALDCEVCLAAMIGKSSPNDCPVCCYECLEMCLQCSRASARNSLFAKDYCQLCAKICDWCAEQCSEHDMEHCQRCADSCRVCADKCRSMAQMN
jgi:hypothetical protein